MADIDSNFVRKLCIKYQSTYPALYSTGNPSGIFEGLRIETFLEAESNEDISVISLNKIDFSIYLQNIPELLDLDVNFYEIRYRNLMMLLGIYPNETPLWLDNHVNNDDFMIFIQREKLLTMLSNNLILFCKLFTATKLYYLGHPYCVESPFDILKYLDPLHQRLRKNQNDINSLKNIEEEIIAQREKIFTPRVIKTNDAYTVHFCVWTSFLGRLFSIEAIFFLNGKLVYSGEQIADNIGYFYK